MKVAVVGAGLVGVRCAAFLASEGRDVTLIGHQRLPPRMHGVNVSRGWSAELTSSLDTVVIATAARHQVKIARALIGTETDVVSTADDRAVVEQLWKLGPAVAAGGQRYVIGAAYSPGVSSVLVRHLARQLDEVAAISTAQFGTGGPECARQHHRASGSSGLEVHDGQLRSARGGSGRELVWFPDPVGAVDCYRANLPEPWLLRHEFPDVSRIESRQAATRRDRLTVHLPMLRPPHPEGLVGAVWVEVRGRRQGKVHHLAMAATAPQATGAAAMAAAACGWLQSASGEGRKLPVPAGVLSTAAGVNAVDLLHPLSEHVGLWAYDGSQIVGDSSQIATQSVARKRPSSQKR